MLESNASRAAQNLPAKTTDNKPSPRMKPTLDSPPAKPGLVPSQGTEHPVSGQQQQELSSSLKTSSSLKHGSSSVPSAPSAPNGHFSAPLADRGPQGPVAPQMYTSPSVLEKPGPGKTPFSDQKPVVVNAVPMVHQPNAWAAINESPDSAKPPKMAEQRIPSRAWQKGSPITQATSSLASTPITPEKEIGRFASEDSTLCEPAHKMWPAGCAVGTEHVNAGEEKLWHTKLVPTPPHGSAVPLALGKKSSPLATPENQSLTVPPAAIPVISTASSYRPPDKGGRGDLRTTECEREASAAQVASTAAASRLERVARGDSRIGECERDSAGKVLSVASKNARMSLDQSSYPISAVPPVTISRAEPDKRSAPVDRQIGGPVNMPSDRAATRAFPIVEDSGNSPSSVSIPQDLDGYPNAAVKRQADAAQDSTNAFTRPRQTSRSGQPPAISHASQSQQNQRRSELRLSAQGRWSFLWSTSTELTIVGFLCTRYGARSKRATRGVRSSSAIHTATA